MRRSNAALRRPAATDLRDALDAAPTAIAAGALENLAIFLTHGCVRAASRVRLLCARLAADPRADARVRDGARRLAASMATATEHRADW
ncbi:MAG: hypothetical protein AB7O31_17980 [Burkholderiales bacterium]